MERVGLTAAAKKRFRNYSLGMKQRLAIAAALLGSPRVLVLDEPTNGLDAAGITDIRELIKGLRNEGASLLVVEQYVTRALEMADYVYLLQRGRVAFCGQPCEVDAANVLNQYLGVAAGLPSPV